MYKVKVTLIIALVTKSHDPLSIAQGQCKSHRSLQNDGGRLNLKRQLGEASQVVGT